MTARHLPILLLLVALTSYLVVHSVKADTTVNYSMGDRGGVSLTTVGGPAPTTVGYARIQPSGSSSTPTGLAIFSVRNGDVVVSEAGVPASSLVGSGRIYAEVNTTVNTGIAIANPNSQSVTISFYFTDSAGTDLGAGTTVLGPNSQLARFLNDIPFNGASTFAGTFTFTSSLPVSVIALRQLTNERSEVLITTLPVANPSAPVTGTEVFAHFADGAGWATQVVLVNPGENPINGTVQFFSQGSSNAPAPPVNVTIGGSIASSFSYTVPRRSSVRLQTSGTGPVLTTGSIQVIPSPGALAPSGLVVFSFKRGGVTVSEAGVAASLPARTFRVYVEASDMPSITSGVAIANSSSNTIPVSFELNGLTNTAMKWTGTTTIGGNGQVANLLHEIPGMQSVPRPFKGVLRIATTSPAALSVIGLRIRGNERGDTLMTTTPPVEEGVAVSSNELFFPHFADKGGFTTQFVLYSRATGQVPLGSLKFIAQNGEPVDLRFAPYSDLAITQVDSPDPITVGSNLTYTIMVNNNGPSVATATQVIDLLPSDVSFISATPSQGSCPTPSGSVVTCNLGVLPAGSNAILSVVVQPKMATTLINTVAVVASEDDALSSNNQNTEVTSLVVRTDLTITQKGRPSCFWGVSCDDVPYTIVVTNSGPFAATGVTVSDTLPRDPPSGIPVATVSSKETDHGSCSDVFKGEFTCSLGTLPANGVATLTVKMDIAGTAVARTVVNHVVVTGTDVDDTDSTNNANNYPMYIDWMTNRNRPPTDLEVVSVTYEPNPARVGQNLTLTVTVNNRGLATATDIWTDTVFTSQIPVFVSATSTLGSCGGLIEGRIRCSFGVLIPNSPQVITIAVRPIASGKLLPNVSISRNPLATGDVEEDRNQSNNSIPRPGQPLEITVN